MGQHPSTDGVNRRRATTEFLIEIEIKLPHTVANELRERLIAAEGIRGRELADQGVIRAIWRTPGRFANCGIWSAPDATTLHTAIASLPLFQFLDVHVTPLARHDLSQHCPSFAPGLIIDDLK